MQPRGHHLREGRIVEIADIRTLQQNTYKKVRVEVGDLDPAYFDVPGVTNLERHDSSIRFFYKGDINVVMRKLSEVRVSDVTIEEPTLEEIFMHYYE